MAHIYYNTLFVWQLWGNFRTNCSFNICTSYRTGLCTSIYLKKVVQLPVWICTFVQLDSPCSKRELGKVPWHMNFKYTDYKISIVTKSKVFTLHAVMTVLKRSFLTPTILLSKGGMSCYQPHRLIPLQIQGAPQRCISVKDVCV